MMKFAEGGALTQPVILGDDCHEAVVAADDINYERLGDFLKVLALDWSLLELELEGVSNLCLKL